MWSSLSSRVLKDQKLLRSPGLMEPLCRAASMHLTVVPMAAVPTIVVVVVAHCVVHDPLPRIVKVKIRLRELKVKVKVNQLTAVVEEGHLVIKGGGVTAEDLHETMRVVNQPKRVRMRMKKGKANEGGQGCIGGVRMENNMEERNMKDVKGVVLVVVPVIINKVKKESQ